MGRDVITSNFTALIGIKRFMQIHFSTLRQSSPPSLQTDKRQLKTLCIVQIFKNNDTINRPMLVGT